MDAAVRGYIDAIPAEHRPLFDRIHQLVLAAHPGQRVVLSYKMPAYQVGGCHLYIGAWKHGVSVYGWKQGRDAGFTARHPRVHDEHGGHPAAARGRGRHLR